MLFKPKFKLKSITDISPQLLLKNDISCLILDVDNTMSTHHGMQLTAGLESWLGIMRQNNIRLIILSNSRRRRVEPFAAKIGLDYISTGLKPLPFGYLRAVRRAGARRVNTAIVGDQIFTDVTGGNILGIKTILLDPILPETGPGFRFKRRLEKILLNKYRFD